MWEIGGKNVPNWGIAVSVFLTLVSALQVHCSLQGGLTGVEKEALGDDSCQYSHQQKAAQGLSTRPRAGKQEAMGNAWLTVLNTKKTQSILFHFSGSFSFIHHYIATRDKQKTGRPTCRHQIRSLMKSRTHVYYEFDPFAIFSLSISEYYKPHLPASYERKLPHCRHWTE